MRMVAAVAMHPQKCGQAWTMTTLPRSRIRKGLVDCRVVSLLVAVAATAMGTVEGCASYCVYVGKNLTVDGSVLLGGYGDEPSSHWLEIVPRREHPEGAQISVGANHE